MWQTLMKFIPSFQVWMGALASLMIPLFATWLIKILHDWGDPPWLKKQKQPARQSRPLYPQNNQDQQ